MSLPFEGTPGAEAEFDAALNASQKVALRFIDHELPREILTAGEGRQISRGEVVLAKLQLDGLLSAPDDHLSSALGKLAAEEKIIFG